MPNANASPGPLDGFTDWQLEQEIKIRRANAAKVIEAKINANSVRIVCPRCNGSKIETYYDMRVAAGESSGEMPCTVCDHKGYLIGQRCQ